MVVGGFGWLWLFLGGFGWLWVVWLVVGGFCWLLVVLDGSGWFWLVAYLRTNNSSSWSSRQFFFLLWTQVWIITDLFLVYIYLVVARHFAFACFGNIMYDWYMSIWISRKSFPSDINSNNLILQAGALVIHTDNVSSLSLLHVAIAYIFCYLINIFKN